MIPVGHRISPDAARSLRIVRVHDLSVPGNLSRVSWKLSRTVLRGGTSREVGPLLDQNNAKQPYIFEMAKDELFAFAGLWDRWSRPGGNAIESCTILTTKPNQLLSGIHDRMPVILEPANYDLWLDPAFKNAEDLTAMLEPFPAQRMRRHAVSTHVNDPKNDDPECAKPFEPQLHPSQEPLF
jgi:hypothetical protein